MYRFFHGLTAFLCVLMCLALFVPVAFSEGSAEEDPLGSFAVRHGSRNSNQVAITMDDIFETEYAWKSVELCRKYGVAMTFFPIGIILKEKEREEWKDLISSGCEIGCHSLNHLPFYGISESSAIRRLGRFQEKLDEVLGFHYQARWFRPPYGKIKSAANDNSRVIERAIRKFGYSNIILWDVSETNATKAIKKVKNGSILLFHARKKDYECLVDLIPQLQEAGFKPVTVSKLFGFDSPKVSDELYSFNINDYRKAP